MSKKAMKLALEALKQMQAKANFECWNLEICDEAIKALEEALAKQEQGEPFGWYDMEHGEIRDVEWNRLKPTYEGVWRPLYTTPQQRKPLTDEQESILNFLLGANDFEGVWYGERHPQKKGAFWWRDELRKAFQEAAHGIKENT